MTAAERSFRCAQDDRGVGIPGVRSSINPHESLRLWFFRPVRKNPAVVRKTDSLWRPRRTGLVALRILPGGFPIDRILPALRLRPVDSWRDVLVRELEARDRPLHHGRTELR